MRIVEILSHYAGSLLAKQHPLFSCCASCGEIRIPVETRLCTSLSPAFMVDAAYLVPDDDEARAWLRYALRSLECNAPWVRKVFLVRQGALPEWLNPEARGLCVVPGGFFAAAPADEPPEALLHLLPGIEEHHLVLSPRTIVARPCLVHDFFTPNGIPLLFTVAGTACEAQVETAPASWECVVPSCLPGMYAQTGESAAALWEASASGGLPDAAGVAFEERRVWWIYTHGYAIPHVPHRATEFSPDAVSPGGTGAGALLFFQGRAGDAEGRTRLDALFPRPSRFEGA